MTVDLPEYDVDLGDEPPLDAGADEDPTPDPPPVVDDPYPSTGEVIEPTPVEIVPAPRPIEVRV